MTPLITYIPALISIVVICIWVFWGIRYKSLAYLIGVIPFITVWASIDVMAFHPRDYAFNKAPLIYPAVAFIASLAFALISVTIITTGQRNALTLHTGQSKFTVVFSRVELVGLQVFLLISFSTISLINQLREFSSSYFFDWRHMVTATVIASAVGLFILLLLSVAFPAQTTLFGDGATRHEYQAILTLVVWAGLSAMVFWTIYTIVQAFLSFGVGP